MMTMEYKPHLNAGLTLIICVVCAVALLGNVQEIQAGEEDPVASVDTLRVASVDTLRVTVEGLKAGEGTVRVAVFDEAHREEFPEGKYLFSAVVPAAEEQVTVAIANIPPGEYAIAVIQDLNENEKLDRNIFTKPKEPYGFSGTWESGKASFEEALVDMEDVGFDITIKVK